MMKNENLKSKYKKLIGYSFKHYTDLNKKSPTKYYFGENGRIYWFDEKDNDKYSTYYTINEIFEIIKKKYWIIESKYYRKKKMKRILSDEK